MNFQRTQTQDDAEYREAQQLSLDRTRPPAVVPGYDAERFLGAGAYGEVWVAIDRNTGRRVAIKFYAHRGGLDWSLLQREVEKLVYLSADRYVVQLLKVGWDEEPPYYVMEYLEHGSLDDRLRRDGSLSVDEAEALFREVAVALVHAHGRGVLHCDLKPGNVLLDQDQRPRLADFGQSRLSHEQDPALGTLFYMAPEQADLKAIPDARWDVYALGALLYTMLVGEPPYRSDAAITEMEAAGDLDDRLARYRNLIHNAPKPTEHRETPGMDGPLADILERCISANPEVRYPNAQAVLDALDDRDARRANRKLAILGALGPVLLMIFVGLMGLGGLNTAVKKSDGALTDRALDSNLFAAQARAEAVASELERRYRAAERLARYAGFQQVVGETVRQPELAQMLEVLNNPRIDDPSFMSPQEVSRLRKRFEDHPARQALQERLESMLDDPTQPVVASWVVNGPGGAQLARAPHGPTIARNYAWRSYFHAGPHDMPKNWRPPTGGHIRGTTLSAVFGSEATGHWIAGISTPIFDEAADDEFLGVVLLTVEVGSFVRLGGGSDDQLAVLVDWREGANRGLILQHPLFDRLHRVPIQFQDLRIPPEELPNGQAENKAHYSDPMAAHAEGSQYRGRWLADMAPVEIRGEDSGLRVIVQERYEHAIGPALADLKSSLVTIGIGAVVIMVVVPLVLWFLVVRGAGNSLLSRTGRIRSFRPTTAAETMATISDRR